MPYVIEPAAGLTRSLMTFLVDAYTEDEAPNTKGGVDKRTVLRLDPRLAPVKVAVLPLSRNADLTPEGQGPRRRAARALERRLRRRRRDRPPLPPPGRDRHAVLRDRRLRHPRGRRGHGPRARHDDAGADRARRACAPGSPSAWSAADLDGRGRRRSRMATTRRPDGHNVPRDDRPCPRARAALVAAAARACARALRRAARDDEGEADGRAVGRPADRQRRRSPTASTLTKAGHRARSSARPRPSPTSPTPSAARCSSSPSTRVQQGRISDLAAYQLDAATQEVDALLRHRSG